MDPANLQKRCLEVLSRTLDSVGYQWPNEYIGWYEKPFSRLYPDIDVPLDLWSTSQALELLAILFSEIKNYDSSYPQDLEVKYKNSIHRGIEFIIRENPVSIEKSISIEDNYSRKDVLKIVWQLRAISQILKKTNELEITNEQQKKLFKIGENLLKDLFLLQEPNGSWSPFGNLGKSTYVTGMVIWAIADANPIFCKSQFFRPHKVHGTHIALLWLIKNRIDDKGIPFFEGGKIPSISRTSITSIAIWGRQELQCSEPIPKKGLALNNSYIFEHQDQQGGWCDQIEKRNNPDVEVTSLALLALLKNKTNTSHPGIESGINWLLQNFKDKGKTSGWSLNNQDSDIRIWTTWLATLALWEYLTSLKKCKDFPTVKCEIISKPQRIFLLEGRSKKIKIILKSKCPEDTWAYFVQKPKDSIKIIEPRVIHLKNFDTSITMKIVQKKSLLWKEEHFIKIMDSMHGNSLSIPISVISFGKKSSLFLELLTDPKVEFGSISASLALFTVFKFTDQITLKSMMFSIIEIFAIFFICVFICSFCVVIKKNFIDE